MPNSSSPIHTSTHQSFGGVSPEEGFTRLAGDGVKVVAERPVAAHSAHLVFLVLARPAGSRSRPRRRHASRPQRARPHAPGGTEPLQAVRAVHLHLDVHVQVVLGQVAPYRLANVDPCNGGESQG